MLDYIGDLAYEILSNLGSWIWSFFTEFFSWVFEKFVGLIQSLLNACDFHISLVWTTQAFNYVNFFFPLNEVLAFALTFFLLWLTLLGVKIVLKFIPTVY